MANCCDSECNCSAKWIRTVKRKFDEFEEGYKLVIPDLYSNVAKIAIEKECVALREMVSKQQETIQDLSNELEKERNSSFVAADEAMSMILRLQREKAETQMEFRQFKDYVEEKMAHDQQELLAMEDFLYKREHTIESLSCEIMSYKHRLMSFGVTESEVENIGYDEKTQYPPLSCDYKDQLEKRTSDCTSEFEDDKTKIIYTDDNVENVSKAESYKGDTEDLEMKNLFTRLEALESDRESMRKTITFMQSGKSQLIILEEIAQHLRNDIPPPRRMPVKKLSVIANFSIGSLLKGILCFVFWRKKKGRQAKYMLSARHPGLPIILDPSHAARWRCLLSNQV
jgi:hypothetical protein